MEVAERIMFYRTLKGITVNKLANLAGISQSFVREIELGNKKPTVETLALLCDALNISLRDFFDDGVRSSLIDSDLMQQFYRLSPEQQRLLADFLRKMCDTKEGGGSRPGEQR